jgi:hypothetical protein
MYEESFMTTKALESVSRLLDFLNGIIADQGVYIFMAFVFLTIPFLAWVLGGGLRRKLLKGRPMPCPSPAIVVLFPVGRSAPPPEPLIPLDRSAHDQDDGRYED